MIGAIVQARTGSTRLPGKVIMEVSAMPLLAHIIKRLKQAKLIDLIIIATTKQAADNPIKKIAKDMKVKIFTGSQDDVLDRYYQTAKKYKVNTIVRITGDCPLIDPQIIDKLLEYYLKNKDKFDYVGLAKNYPEGLDTEVFTFSALEKAWQEAKLPSEREHVTSYIWNHPKIFRMGRLAQDLKEDFSRLHWSVDQDCDLKFVREIYKRLYRKGRIFYTKGILKLLKKEPQILKINKGFTGFEGYQKSLKEDELFLRKKIKKNHFIKSEELWIRAIKVIPGGTQTLSKAPDQFVQGVTPKYLAYGKGCHVWDVDGNEYIDYPMALGPIILGYAYPAVVQAVIKQLHKGTTFTLMHPLEVELAELLVEVVPCIEMVRFCKNGVDATSAAVRVARAYTGREHIAFYGYHGYQDWYAVTTSRNKGIPRVFAEFMHPFQYNKIKTLERIFSEYPKRIAAVIMEQPGIEPQDNFLQKVLDTAYKNGAVFILDEIVTGFRYALGGAGEYYRVTPDLACFGKGMANGFPLACVGGKKELMKEFNEVFFSTTYGGETLSLAASLATINEIRKKDVIAHLWRLGLKWRDSFSKLAKSIGVDAEVGGAGPRTHFIFKDKDGEDSLEMKSLFLQETVKRGILFGGPIFMSYSHTDKDIEKTLDICEVALCILKKAVDKDDIDRYMEGEKIKVVFRQTL